MKQLIYLILLFIAVSQLSAQQTFKILTYNIRLDTPDDEQNAWVFRKDSVGLFLSNTHPDFFGLQEVVHNQLMDLQLSLTEYQYVGVGRLDGKTHGEYSPVFFNKGKFDLLKNGNFWLSETPEIPGSKGWDAACERIVSWASLKSKESKDTIFVFNTHFDHMGKVARFESAKLILKRISQIAQNHAVVLMGDFNSPTSENAYKLLSDFSISKLTDVRNAQSVLDSQITFMGFDQETENDALIDFVFVNKHFKPIAYQVKKINDRNFYFSDHLPVYTEIQLIK